MQAAPKSDPAPRGKGGTLERLKAERLKAEGQTPEDPKAVAPAPKPDTGARQPARTTAKAEKPARAGRERGRPTKEKKPPVAGIVAGLALVLVGLGAFLFKDKLFGGPAEAATDVAAAPVESAAPAVAEPEPVVAEEADREPVLEEPEEKPKAAPKPKDPSSIDLAAIPDFGPTPDTSAEEWAQMNEHMEVWMDRDAGASGNRAKLALIKESRRAVPALLNYFKKLDFSTPDGRGNGDQCQKALQQICNGTNFDWKYADEAGGRPYDHPDDVWFCKRVAELWCNSWKQAEQSIEAWIKIAKLDSKDPAEANRLREVFGGASPVAEEEPFGSSDDDLEVD